MACRAVRVLHDDADLGTAQRVSPGASASSSQALQRRKRLRHGGTTTPNSGVTHGVVAEANRAARPGAFEQRTEEHHLYHVNLPEIPLLSRVKIRFRR